MEIGREYYIFSKSIKGEGEKQSRKKLAGSDEFKHAVICAALGGDVEQSGLMIDPAEHTVSLKIAFGPGKIQVIPAYQKETLSVAEVVRRLNDPSWLEKNPHHPIALAARVVSVLFDGIRFVQQGNPSIQFMVGPQHALLSVAGDRDKQRRLLSAAGIPEETIDLICATLDQYESQK